MEIQDKKIRPLVLSFRTPPAVRPQSILIGKMMPEWRRQGLKPVIVNYDFNGQWDIGWPIYGIKQFRVKRSVNKILLLKYLLENIYYKKYFGYLKKIIERHNINFIYSFSNPYGSNILGAMLKEKLHIPFVANFSDPWYDDPYQTLGKLEKKHIFKQEQFVISQADKVIFCNEAARRLVMKKYPADWFNKSAVIPHCFGPKDYPATNKEDSDKFLISHIGAFYPQRNPALLFRALKKVMAIKPALKSKIKLNLIGGAGNYSGYKLENLKHMAQDYEIADIIEIIPPVSYEESLKQMKLSDLLVVIDADIKDSPFLTSKVVDYAGSLTAIIGITPTNSPTDKMLAKLGYYSFNYSQLDKLTACLIKLITKQIKPRINQKYLDDYDVKNTTKKLIGYFQEIL